MSVYSKLVPLVWCVHLGTCFYFVRRRSSLLSRFLLTAVPCGILTFVGCSNLQHIQMSSIMVIAFYWMMSIRLVHLTALSPELPLSLGSFLGKFLWFLVPVIECKSSYSVAFDFLSSFVKLLINNWIFRWFMSCKSSDSYTKMAMFYVLLCSGTYAVDLQIGIVRLITRNKYTIESFNDSPFLSRSLREFWGRRYNRVINTILRESVYQPLRRLSFPSAGAVLSTFVVSGLLHAHVAIAGFGASSPLPAFSFFLLQGIGCCLEALSPITLPKPMGILATHAFLLVTAPLYVGLFTRAGPDFFLLNAPTLSNIQWIPQIPIPKFCPQ